MSYLVDTNVFSELTRATPDPNVVTWMRDNENQLYISTISLGELKYGISVLPDGKRKTVLQAWLSQTAKLMEGTTLAFNRSAAYVWADLRASAKSKGIDLPLADGMIAAIARRHDLTVVTRNISDFKHARVKTINPYE